MSGIAKVKTATVDHVKNCMRQLAAARSSKGDYEFQTALLDDSDVTMIVFMITNIAGVNDEYKGGEYVGIIKHPNPDKPPELMILTPNGFCQTNTYDICISISKYHANNYRPSLGWLGYLKNFTGTMILWEATKHGISLLYGSSSVDEQRANIRQLAAQSHDWNAKHLTKYLNILNGDIDEDLAESMAAIAIEEETRKEQERIRKDKMKSKTKRHARPSKTECKK